MKQFIPQLLQSHRRKLYQLRRYWVEPVISFKRIVNSFVLYARYLSDWSCYRRMADAEPLHFEDSFPQIFDVTETTPFDAHYFYQAVWALERIPGYSPSVHVDIGSEFKFIGALSTHVPVTFIDIRPIRTNLPALTCMSSDILSLPFDNSSVDSLSCLHVAEHIGLGRYGDTLNPAGTRLACAELERILAFGGNLFFSLPMGKPQVCFNTHRIHSPTQIVGYFNKLKLVEFSVVDDQGILNIGASPGQFEEAYYACGLFHFRKKA